MTKKFDHIRPPREWQPYWSTIPGGSTILEALLTWVGQVNKMTDNVNDWNSYLDTFVNQFDKQIQPTIDKFLREMAEDGTLDKVINEYIFADLNNEITNIGEYAQQVNTAITSRLNDFDFLNTEPSFLANLNLRYGTIMQAFIINYERREIYATQTNGYYPGSAESYTLNRLSMNGDLIDSMDLEHGGHGTLFGIENTPEGVIIWSAYDQVDGDNNTIGHDLVSFKYAPGAVYNYNSKELSRYNKFTSSVTLPVVDEKNDRIALRIGTENSQIIEIRKLSDIKQGIDNLLHTFTIPIDLKYLQGATLDGDHFYWYTGDTNGREYPLEITLFDVRTGKIVHRKQVDFGRSTREEFEQGFFEPEGLYLFTHPKTGSKSLFAGLITDGSNQRQNKIFGYHSLTNETIFLSEITQGLQNYQLTDNSGYTKEFPSDVKDIQEVIEPGHYHISAGRAEQLTGLPIENPTAWYLDVLPPAWRGRFRQFLQRDSTHPDNMSIYHKTYGDSNAHWEQLTGRPNWQVVPLAINFSQGSSSLQVAFTNGNTQVAMKGRVQLTGTYSNGVVIGTLAPEYRPKDWYYFNASVDGGQSAYIRINSNGQITLHSSVAQNTDINFFNSIYYTN